MLNLINQLGLDYEIDKKWSISSLFGNGNRANAQVIELELKPEVKSKQYIHINEVGDGFYDVVRDEITIAKNVKTGELFSNESITIQINGRLSETFKIEVLSKEKLLKNIRIDLI